MSSCAMRRTLAQPTRRASEQGLRAPSMHWPHAAAGQDSGPRGDPQRPWLPLPHAHEANHGHKQFDWFENAIQFGSVWFLQSLNWCGVV